MLSSMPIYWHEFDGPYLQHVYGTLNALADPMVLLNGVAKPSL